MYSRDDENILVKKILDGSPEDFRVLIQQYRRLVSQIVSRLIDNPIDREELGQDIFVKVYQNLSSFQFNSKVSTWIARIAYNSCLNYLRKKKLPLYDDLNPKTKSDKEDTDTSKTQIDGVFSPDDKPDKILENKQITAFVQDEINTLPVHFKAVLIFYYFDDMSQQEISEITELPINTVKSHIFRARKSLKDRLLEKYKREELCQ